MLFTKRNSDFDWVKDTVGTGESAGCWKPVFSPLLLKGSVENTQGKGEMLLMNFFSFTHSVFYVFG